MESTFEKYDRVVYIGDSIYKHNIGTVKTANPKNDRMSVSFKRSNHHLFTTAEEVVKLDIHESIPDGVDITDCCVRPLRTHPNQYLPEQAIGKVFQIAFIDSHGVTIKPDDIPQSYWVRHDCYRIVPNYKMAWVLKDLVLHKETVAFNRYIEDHVEWQTEDGQLVKDSLVHDNITDGLDYARKFKQNGPIKVVR